jgi:hypothetical protein
MHDLRTVRGFMSKIPSVKGTVFVGVVEAVKKLMADGKATRKDAERFLEPADLTLLDEKLSISSWYDIRTYDRFNRMLRDIAGSGDDNYMRELGRESARRLGQAGTYSQLEYVTRTQMAALEDPKQRFEAFARDLRLMQSITGSIYNFIEWSLEPEPGHQYRYRIVWKNCAALSDLNCLRAEGFMNEMGAVNDHPNLWKFERKGKDVVIFRMTHDL